MKKPNPTQALIDCSRQFYQRGWMWGTGGNLSVRQQSNPLRFTVTPSGVAKGKMETSHLLTLTEGKPYPKHAQNLIPSAETAVHEAIYKAVPGAQAVFHVHPVYSTVLTSFYGHPKEVRFLRVEWIEIMKGVGFNEGEHADIAILPNWQDISLLARDVTNYLKTSSKTPPAVLIYNHGLTGWGTTPDQALNHVEVMEYVCQYLYLKKACTR